MPLRWPIFCSRWALERALMVDCSYLDIALCQVVRPHPNPELLVLHYLQFALGLSPMFIMVLPGFVGDRITRFQLSSIKRYVSDLFCFNLSSNTLQIAHTEPRTPKERSFAIGRRKGRVGLLCVGGDQNLVETVVGTGVGRWSWREVWNSRVCLETS